MVLEQKGMGTRCPRERNPYRPMHVHRGGLQVGRIAVLDGIQGELWGEPRKLQDHTRI
jgi:hypothetical protein